LEKGTKLRNIKFITWKIIGQQLHLGVI